MLVNHKAADIACVGIMLDSTYYSILGQWSQPMLCQWTKYPCFNTIWVVSRSHGYGIGHYKIFGRKKTWKEKIQRDDNLGKWVIIHVTKYECKKSNWEIRFWELCTVNLWLDVWMVTCECKHAVSAVWGVIMYGKDVLRMVGVKRIESCCLLINHLVSTWTKAFIVYGVLFDATMK